MRYEWTSSEDLESSLRTLDAEDTISRSADAPPTAATIPPGAQAGDGNGGAALDGPTLDAPGTGSGNGHERAGRTPTPPPEQSYRLRKMIGRGGMGEVWEAEQASLGRVVAVKRLLRRGGAPEGGETSARREQDFRNEAVVSARLEHPGIVPVHDLGVDEQGAPLMAMKLVHGSPWSEILRDDREVLDDDSFLEKHLPILMDMAQAVAFAHSKGVVHRDLKPSQVMVGGFGEVLLMDWGLAVVMDRGAQEVAGHPLPSVASASNPAGTPALMAPEQTQSSTAAIGPHTDVYLLGGTLYYLLTNFFPHAAPTAAMAFAKAEEGIVDPPEARAPGRRIPQRLAAIAMRALAKDPADRQATALELLADLREYSSGAARRRESAEIAAAAGARLDAGLGDYAACSEVDAELSRALLLWPANGEAEALREGLLRRFAEMALEAGDLTLARVQCQRLAAGPERADIAQRIAAREARVARQHRQRRIAVAAAAVFAVAVGVLGLSLREAFTERARQAGVAALLGEVNALRREEVQLADAFAAAFPVPRHIGESLTVMTAAIDTSAGSFERVEELRAAREELERRADADLGERPVQLAMAEALGRFYSARGREDYLPLADEFERIAGMYPLLPDPAFAAAVASAIGEDYGRAADWAREAGARVEARVGTSHPDFIDALRLEAAVVRMMDASDPVYLALARQSLDLSEPALLRQLHRTAEVHENAGQIREAIAYRQFARDRRAARGESPDEENPHGLAGLALLHATIGEFDEFRRLAGEFEANHLHRLDTRAQGIYHAGRAHAEVAFGFRDEARRHIERSAELLRGDDDGWSARDRLTLLRRIVFYNLSEHQGPAVEHHAREALEISLGAYGPNTFEYARSRGDLGSVLSQAGRFEDALVEFRAAAAAYRALDPSHPELQWLLANYASAVEQAPGGTRAQGRELLAEGLEAALGTGGSVSPVALSLAERLAWRLCQEDRRPEAARVILDAWTAYKLDPAILALGDGASPQDVPRYYGQHQMVEAIACMVPALRGARPDLAAELLETLIELAGHPASGLTLANRYYAYNLAAHFAAEDGEDELALSLIVLADDLPMPRSSADPESWRSALQRRARAVVLLDAVDLAAPAFDRVLAGLAHSGDLGMVREDFLRFAVHLYEHDRDLAAPMVEAAFLRALEAADPEAHEARGHLEHVMAVLLVQRRDPEALERFRAADRAFLRAGIPPPVQLKRDRTDTGSTYRQFDDLAVHSALEVGRSLLPGSGADPGRIALIAHNWAVLSMDQAPGDAEAILRFAVQTRLEDEGPERAESLFRESRSLVAAHLGAARAGGSPPARPALAAAFHVDSALMAERAIAPGDIADNRGRGWIAVHAAAARGLAAELRAPAARAMVLRGEALVRLFPTPDAVRAAEAHLRPVAESLRMDLAPFESGPVPRALPGDEVRAALDAAAPHPGPYGPPIATADFGGEGLRRAITAKADAIREAYERGLE